MGLLQKSLPSLLLMIGLGQVSFAQNERNLRLDEAVNLGLENSKQLKIAVSKSRQAVAATREMKDNIVPDLSVSGQYMRLNQPGITLGPAFSGGGSSGGSGGEPVPPKYLMLGQASAKMPLFTGFKIKNGIQSAKYLEKAANLDVEFQRSEVILNIVGAYVNLYKAQASVELVQKNLEQAQKRVKDFTNLEQNGVLAKNDLLNAQLQESNASLALLDAENNQRVANHNVNLMLGLEEETKLTVDSLSTETLPELLSLGELREQAIIEREDLKAMAEREKASEALVKISKSEYYPTVALSGGYIAADVDNMLTLTNALNIGLGVSWNLSSFYKSGAKIHQAKERLLQTELMYNQLSDHVKSEVYSAFSEYQESIKRIAVLEKANEQATENYRITKNKHSNNLATTTDLLDANLHQFQSALQLKYARMDAWLAYCTMLEVSGQLEEQTINKLVAQ